MMFRSLLPVLFAALLHAQTAPPAPAGQPPADVDRALRARITAFYNLIVKHDYRRAEELVAPDTREVYYEREKPRYLSFEITSIAWSENYTHAEVVVTARVPTVMPMNPVPLEQQITGIWRLLDGAWYWAPPKVGVTDLVKSMFGAPKGDVPEGGQIIRVAPGAGTALPDLNAAGGGTVLPSNMNLPGGMGRPESMQLGTMPISTGHLQVDRPSVTISSSSSEKVTLTNGGPTPMTFFVLGKLDDVEATFDPPSIKPGGKAVLTLKAGPHAKGGPLLIGVTENNEIVSLRIAVK
jgi:hypothetical protein